jgi:hypothetical protein
VDALPDSSKSFLIWLRHKESAKSIIIRFLTFEKAHLLLLQFYVSLNINPRYSLRPQLVGDEQLSAADSGEGGTEMQNAKHFYFKAKVINMGYL